MECHVLDMVCLQAGDNRYVVLGIVQKYKDNRNYEVLAVGTYRDLLQQFGKYVVWDMEEKTLFLHYNSIPYSQGELLEHVRELCEESMTVEEFTKLNDFGYLVFDAQADNRYDFLHRKQLKTTKSLRKWIDDIRQGRQEGHGITIKMRITGKEMCIFRHGDKHDYAKYLIMQDGHFVVRSTYESPTITNAGFQASLLLWNTAIRFVANYCESATVHCAEGFQLYVLRVVDGQCAGLHLYREPDEHAYGVTTLRFASTYLSYAEARSVLEQENGKHWNLIIDRYEYNGNGWACAERNCGEEA